MESLSCPYCNSQIGEYALKCPNCNSKLKTICKKCGKVINTNWTECPDCGDKIYYEDITPILKDSTNEENKTQIYSDFMPNVDTVFHEGKNEQARLDFYPIETKTQIYGDLPEKEFQTMPNERQKKLNIIKIAGTIFVILIIFIISSFTTTPNAENYYNKGYSLYYAGDYNRAIEKLDKALELDPKYLDAYILKGIALYDQNYYYKAIDCYNKAIEIDPNNANAWWNKGRALYRLDRKVEANECFNKAKELGYKG
jgi:tetratricopeptide (TPR) repeat protein